MEHDRQQAQFGKLLNNCRDQVLQRSHSLLTDMFMRADDSLLDAAENAESNSVRNRYFEAMREIRRKRVPVEHTFRKHIENGFEAFALGKPIPRALKGRDSDNDTELSLVKKTDLDESVAIQNITSKANNNFFHTLYELRQRLAVLNGGKKVDSSNMPSGPSHLCDAFWDSAQAFEVDTDVRLIIFSLFEQFVMRKAEVIYDGFNKQLLDAGLLPNIASVIRKELEVKYDKDRPHAGSKPAAIPDIQKTDNDDLWPSEMDTQAGQDLYRSLFELLAIRRENSPVGSPVGYTHPTESDNRQPINRLDLVSAINALQPATSTAYGIPAGGAQAPNIQIGVDPQRLDSIRDTLTEEREKLFSEVKESEQSVDLVDADTIELVGMLFEFMLNYEALPNAAKALISHLHTPFLKTAVLDKEFLIRSSHPARELLNTLVDAGCRWVNESSLESGIFPHMQEIVERVLDELKDDLSLFDELLASFSATVEEFKTKTQVIENRSREAAKGRDKFQVAKEQAIEEVTSRIGNRNLPEEMVHFLLKPWTDRLTFILLRNSKGKESEEWKSAIKIEDALIWSVGPKNSEQERRRLKKVLPRLRSSIEEGLSALGGSAHIHAEVLFETIEAQLDRTTHIAFRKPARPTSTTPPKQQTSPDVKPEGLSANKPSASRVKVQLTAEEQSMVDKLKKVEYGTWFELHADDKEKMIRAKLSWFSPITSNYMFVDNSGVQCSVISIENLASDMLSGKAKLMKFSRIPFVDRALKAIRSILERPASQPA